MVLTETCPSANDLAAFLEGRLEGDERNRVVQHLNRCPDCLELYVSAARLQADLAREEEPPAPGAAPAADSPALPFHATRQRKRSWLLPLAAVLTVTVGVTALQDRWSRRLPPFDVESSTAWTGRLAATQLAFLANHVDDVLPAYRGEGDDDLERAQQAFQWGARTVDRAASLHLPEVFSERTRNRLLALRKEAYVKTSTCRGLPQDLASPRWEACLAGISRVYVDSPHFRLGQWSQATRLAMVAEAWQALQANSLDTFPQRMLGIEKVRGSLDPEIQKRLGRVQALFFEGLAPEERPALRHEIDAIVRFYDPPS